MEATQTLGKFKLVRHIATGGMAEIWLAEQVGPGGFAKELVIKRILPHLAQDQQFTNMFLDEARLVAQLTHPKIAQIYELGQLDGHYFIAMEFVEGIDVAGIIEQAQAKNRMLPIGIVVKMIIDTLEALDYAHDYTSRDGQPYHLVHRDVTPHNVLVSNDGIVKLVDFGVAKAKQNQSKTQTGAVKGKFAYMAPEQIQNRELDRRVDIFATGVMLYEMLTLAKPFGEDLAAVSNILSSPAPDPRTLRPDIPELLWQIIQKSLAKNPDDRFLDAHSMMLELQNYLRTTGEFVGDREVASFIRELQGLPTVRHTANIASSQSRVTPMELNTPVPPIDSKPMATIATPPPMQGFVATAQVGPIVSHNDGGTLAVELPQKSNTTLIVVFVVLLLALAVGGVAVFFLVIDESKAVDPKPAVITQPTKPDKPVKPIGKTPIPASFNHPDGRIVYLKTATPDITVEFQGTPVGTTPLDTRLRPGDYTVVLKKGAKQVSQSFKVVDKTVNSIDLKF
ncbi:MAG: protein kinase [bacterium]